MITHTDPQRRPAFYRRRKGQLPAPPRLAKLLATEVSMNVNIHDAKTTLSRLIAHVEAGEEVILTRRNLPVARIVPYTDSGLTRVFGDMSGVFEVPDSFMEPPTESDVAAWER
jgi:prevent-host-death family protein